MSDRYAFFASGAMVGAIVSFIGAPSVLSDEKCIAYKIRNKAVTAYVLKPPYQPAPDPVIIKENCEQPKSDEPVVESKPVEEEKTRKRHRRYRRYWR